MEIIIGVIILGGIVYIAYNHLNKEKADGTHPLDSVTKPVEEKQPAEVYEPVKVVEPTPAPAPKARKAPAKKVAANVTTNVAKQAKKRAPAKPASK
jgi:hypothetical protein